MEGSAQLVCRQCDWQLICGPAQMLGWLRDVKMTRRDALPDPELLAELFRSAVPRFACPRCGVVGLSLGTADTAEEEEDDEAWGMARKCDDCDGPIAAERLEVFPDTRLCVACQTKSDRGEATGPEEYCPHCGSVMTLSQSRRGLTRYVMKCPSCRK